MRIRARVDAPHGVRRPGRGKAHGSRAGLVVQRGTRSCGLPARKKPRSRDETSMVDGFRSGCGRAVRGDPYGRLQMRFAPSIPRQKMVGAEDSGNGRWAKRDGNVIEAMPAGSTLRRAEPQERCRDVKSSGGAACRGPTKAGSGTSLVKRNSDA